MLSLLRNCLMTRASRELLRNIAQGIRSLTTNRITMFFSWPQLFFATLLGLLFSKGVCLKLSYSEAGLEIKLGENGTFYASVSDIGNVSDLVVFMVTDSSELQVEPSVVHFTNLSDVHAKELLTVTATGAGYAVVFANYSQPSIEGVSVPFVHVTVYHHASVRIIIAIVGWVYFVAWSLSFYPQIWKNFRRKSVEGFSFDFLALNMLGHASYLLFNAGMFWSPVIQDQYFSQPNHQHGMNPVLINDVLFSIHAVIATHVQAIQCCIFDRGGQKLSRICIIILSAVFLFIATCLVLTLTDEITWLTYLYYFSYVKLGITFVKYCPQVYSNYKRKSTKGFSVGYAILDFVGGTQSILQMFLMAYNYDDWASISGDFTKLGLGLLTAFFDIIFMVQHFVLYRGKGPTDLTDGKDLKLEPRRKQSLVVVSDPAYERKESSNGVTRF